MTWNKLPARERRAMRAVDAAARQAKRDDLNTMQKLGKLAGRPGDAKREKARLLGEVTE